MRMLGRGEEGASPFIGSCVVTADSRSLMLWPRTHIVLDIDHSGSAAYGA